MAWALLRRMPLLPALLPASLLPELPPELLLPELLPALLPLMPRLPAGCRSSSPLLSLSLSAQKP
jgi:hypothetical protein